MQIDERKHEAGGSGRTQEQDAGAGRRQEQAGGRSRRQCGRWQERDAGPVG